MLENKKVKNVEVLVESNPNSKESYPISVIFEGKTLIFENCNPKKRSNVNIVQTGETA